MIKVDINSYMKIFYIYFILFGKKKVVFVINNWHVSQEPDFSDVYNIEYHKT